MGLWASYSATKSNMSCHHLVFSFQSKRLVLSRVPFHFSLPGNVLFTCYTWCDKLYQSNPTYKILQALMCVLGGVWKSTRHLSRHLEGMAIDCKYGTAMNDVDCSSSIHSD